MDTSFRSYRDIIRFAQVASIWQDKPENAKNSKRKYAIGRVLKDVRAVVEDYNDALAELNIRHCEADDKGRILTDDKGSFIYRKEALSARNKETRTLLDTEVNVGIYFEQTPGPALTPFEEEAFAGFIFPELTEPAE